MRGNKLFLLACLSFLISLTAKAFGNAAGSLELIDFTVIQNVNKIDIKWSTSIETGGPFFTIEKSKDGKNFTKLVDLPGNEFGTNYSDYFETDYQPYSGVSYYRIKQTDDVGNFRYSQTVTLKLRSEEENIISCIAVTDESLINQENQILLVLRDTNGRDFYSLAYINTENNNASINLFSAISPGTYRVISTSNEKIYCHNLVIK